MSEGNATMDNGRKLLDDKVNTLWQWLRERDEEWDKKLKIAAKEGEELAKKLRDEILEKDDIILNLREDIKKKKYQEEVKHNSALNAEIDSLRSQLIFNREELAKLDTSLKSTKDDLDNSLAEKQTITNECDKLKEVEKKYQEEAEQNISTLKVELYSVRLQLTETAEELANLKVSLNLTKDKLDQSLTDKLTISNECEKLKEEKRLLDKQVRDQTAETLRLGVELKAMKSAKDVNFMATSKTVGDLGDQLLSKEKELDALRKELDVIKAKYKKDSDVLANLKLHIRENVKPMLVKINSETVQMNDVNIRLKREKEVLKAEVTQLKSTVLKQQDTYLELLNVKNAQEFNKKIASELKEKIKVANDMQKLLSDRSSLEADLKLQLSQMKEKYQALQAERFVLKRAISHFRAERRKSKGQIKSPVKSEPN